MTPRPDPIHHRPGDDYGTDALLGIEYSQQLRYKERVLGRAMERHRDGIEGKMKPCLPSPYTSGYRNRGRMAVGLSRHRDGEVRLGYFRPRSREIVDASDCQILIPELLDTTRAFRRLLERKTRSFPRELRHIDVRCGSDPRHQHMILVVRSDTRPRLPIDAIRQACRYLDGISINLNPSAGPYVLKGPIEPLWGSRDLFVDSTGLRLRVSAGSFFQVNLDILPEIHRLMVDFLDHGECLADLYSGVGTHGLALRRRFDRLLFVEGVRAAVADTKATLERYGIDHARVVARPVERSIDDLLDARPDAVVMNPSRAGATREVLDALGTSDVRRIAYLSCDPETLARDLDLLVRHGFHLVSLQPIDMMPQTRQVEALALLERVRSRR
ncbi:MAG: hypothetical protein AAGE94_07735 [Acidobacteriota bacterium]